MKPIFLFLSILFAVQIGQSQETWNACNSTVTVIPTPSYDSTFVLEAPSRAALQKGMANWVPAASGGGASYLVYTALLTQSGTDAPVATVLDNTLGTSIAWAYDDIGRYIGTLASNVFVSDKTCVFGQAIDGYVATPHSIGNGEVYIQVRDETFTLSDDYLDRWMIEIRVYP